MQHQLSADEITEFLAKEFPQVAGRVKLEACEEGRARIRMKIGEGDLRPGGTVSGPTIFALADLSIYVLVLATAGPKALAVTTSCAIDFMRKPAPVDLVGEARLLKLGRRLAVGDVLVYSDGLAQPIARAGVTYSIPE